MLTLLLGADWVSTRNEILDMLAQDVRNEQPNRIFMVPELISHDTERRLCAAAGDTACRFAEVLTFTRLVQRVSDAVGHGAEECLDSGGRLVAMAAAARQLHGQLKSYAAVESKPEFLTGLIDAVDEFKLCCISSEDLKQASERSEGVLAQKLSELSMLLMSYDALCQQGKRDPRDLMTWLLEQLEDSDFAENHVFYVDGFPDFTRQHMAILEHMILHSPHVVIGLNCDAPNSSEPAFEKAGQTASDLIRFAKKKGVKLEIRNIPSRMDHLSAVRNGIFSRGNHEHAHPNDQLFVLCGKSAYDECLIAANRILDLVESGARYRDISLVCANMPAYQNMIDLAFRRCHIPIYQSGTEPVLDKSVIHTVLAAIDVAVDGFEQADVIRYMKSILSPLDIQACDKLENYAIMWNITGRLWQSDWTNHPKGLVEHWSEHDTAELDRLNADRSRLIDPLVHLQKGLQQSVNIRCQVEALYNFLLEIRYSERLSALAAQFDQDGDNRNAQILNQLWEILLSALEQLYDVLGETVWDGETFTRLLRLLLSQYNVGTIPPVLDAVTVGPVSAMRCQQTKHLIVIGANEGSLPGYGGTRGVLTEQERAALRDLGVPLTGGAMDSVQAEFADIYGFFCGAEQSVTVTCSGSQPSAVYRRLLSLASSERAVDTSTVTARADCHESAAYFLRHDDRSAAARLHIAQEYDALHKKRSYKPGNLERETVVKLYGSKLNLSASQVDKQALCRMAYFLRYGLKAKERKTLTVDPAEFGTYVHAVLELTAKDVMELGGFHQVSLEKTLEIAAAHSQTYADTHFSQLNSERLTYLFQRNSQELNFVVQEMWDELRNSEFVPVGFEVGFGEDKEISPIQIPSHALEAQLNGFVDRVDMWSSDGRTYFKIVDYKTGKKDFDYCDIFNGLGLQMLLYLFTLEDNGQFLLGDDPIAAGVQYFPARAPYILVDGMDDEPAIMAMREKAWKRKGLLLEDVDVLHAMDTGKNSNRLCVTVKKDGSLSGDFADSGQFKLLRAYVFLLLGKIVDEIASGCVDPNPYTRGSSDHACRFCPYGPVCHPATVEGRRNYKAITAQKFWEDAEKEVNAHG